MDKYYKVLLNIYLKHEFYIDGKLDSAILTPLPETALFFKNHRMLLKRKKDCFVLLQEASVESNEATIPCDEITLWFGLNFNDQNYQLRSGLNYDLRQQKIVVQLESKEQTRIDLNNVLPVWNSPENLNTELSHVIIDKENNLIFTSETDSILRFTSLDTGVYKFEQQYFLKCNSCKEFDAVVSLKLDPSQLSVNQNITMPAGRYHWRYHVLKKYNMVKTLSLIDENENVFFEAVPSNEEDRFIFLSKVPVKLAQFISTSLILMEQETVVKKFLPLPEITNARFLNAQDKLLVLEAFVTI
jgi:hypothetical protein